MIVGSMPPGTWIAPRISATPTTFMPRSLKSFTRGAPTLPVPGDHAALFPREPPHSLKNRTRADRPAERRRAGVTEGPADGERLTRDDAMNVVSGEHRHRVHDPTHDLRVGIDVRRGDVTVRSDHRGDGERVTQIGRAS